MRHIPKLHAIEDAVQTGETTLCEGVGLPLSFGHAYIAVLVCLSGRARFTLNFKEQVVRPGEIVVLAEDTIALIKQRSRCFRVFFCLMPKDFAAEVAYQLPSSLFVFLHQHPHCIPATDDKPLIEGWLARMRDIVRSCPTYMRIMLRNELQNFFLKIAEQLPVEQEGSRSFSRKEALSWRFWDLIGKNCMRQREVKFYADALSITPFYLSQLTKEYFRDSPKALIDRQVNLEIKALLLYSNLTIGQIADELDFADASYLCRYFKRQTGVSLSRYRKRERDGKGQD